MKDGKLGLHWTSVEAPRGYEAWVLLDGQGFATDIRVAKTGLGDYLMTSTWIDTRKASLNEAMRIGVEVYNVKALIDHSVIRTGN